MIPDVFAYERPETREGALALLAEHGDEAKVLAGGHSLLPLMKLRLARPSLVVDVARLYELSYVREEDGFVCVGATTRHHDLATSDVARASAPLLAHVAGQVGDPQVRHRGTLGGSLVHGDPASDLPAAVLALGGTLVVEGPSGRRTIDAREFFVSFFEVAIAPDEMLVEIRVPSNPGERWAFEKLTKRAQDWAIVGAAVTRRASGVGVALINVAPVPLRAAAVEEALAAGAGADEAAQLAAEGTDPSSDFNASPEYRRHLARVLVRRALQKAGF